MALIERCLEESSGGIKGDDAGPPEVSIIILNWNKSALTLRARP